MVSTEPLVLSTLMRPSSIAVVGASPANSFGGRSVRHLKRIGYAGKVFPVNPNYDEVFGWKCYPSVADVPENIDVAVIAVASKAVKQVIVDLGTKGCKAAVVLSSGFGESGAEGAELQRELVATARQLGMRLVGPNCNGVVNFLDNVVLGPTTLMERKNIIPGNAAIVSQSGSIGASVVDMAMEQGLGFSYSIAVGNSADTGIEDFIYALSSDSATRVIMVVLEAVRNADEFCKALDFARANEKSVVVLKLGRSSTGEEIVATHTGSMAGSWRILKAVLERHGAIIAQDMEELVAAAAVCSNYPKFSTGKVAVMSSSGGMCSLLVDQLDEAGLKLADLTEETIEFLEQFGYSKPFNPLDFSKIPRPESRQVEYLDCLESLCNDTETGAVIVGLGLSHLVTERASYTAQVKKKSSKPILAYIPKGEIFSEARQHLMDAGVPAFENLQTCISVLRACNIQKSTNIQKRKKEAKSAEAGGKTIGEAEAKELLKRFGVQTPAELVVLDEAEACVKANEMGYPVVLKIYSSKGIHKSDLGLVFLGIHHDSDLKRSFAQLREKAEALGLWEGKALLAKMIDTKRGVELIAGVQRDPIFGPVCLIGAGGIWTEALDDSVVVPFPVTEEALREAVGSLRIGQVLVGEKQRYPMDVDALWPTVMGICAAFESLGPEAVSFEVNPLCVMPKGEGCYVLDARGIIVSPSHS